MQTCTMAQHSLWPLDLVSLLQVQRWRRSCSLLFCATSCSAWPQSRSHPRTCLSRHCFMRHCWWLRHRCSVWRKPEPCCLLWHLLCADHQWWLVLQLPHLQPVRVRRGWFGCRSVPCHSPI